LKEINRKFQSLNDEKKKVLIVEDDDTLRELFSLLLERFQFEVVSASNGVEALELYNDTIDIVLTDIVMPLMGGIELIKELQQQDPNLKCIAITGFSNVKVPPEIQVLHKPITGLKLANSLKKKLAGA